MVVQVLCWPFRIETMPPSIARRMAVLAVPPLTLDRRTPYGSKALKPWPGDRAAVELEPGEHVLGFLGRDFAVDLGAREPAPDSLASKTMPLASVGRGESLVHGGILLQIFVRELRRDLHRNQSLRARSGSAARSTCLPSARGSASVIERRTAGLTCSRSRNSSSGVISSAKVEGCFGRGVVCSSRSGRPTRSWGGAL